MEQELLVSIIFQIAAQVEIYTAANLLSSLEKQRGGLYALSIMPLGKPFKTFQGGEGIDNKAHSNTARKFILLFLKKISRC